VKYKISITIPVLLLMLASAMSCIQVGGGSSPRAELSVINEVLIKDEAGGVALKVTVKNTGPVKAELAEVKVSFYDAQKELIDSTRDSVLNLGPNETWEFTIPCMGERCGEIMSYEIQTTAGTSSGGL
jgi:hypothetical protein